MNLLDTGIIIELIRQKRYEVGAISVITLIEVLRGIGARKRLQAKKLLEESFEVLNLDNKTIELYCSLYQKLKSEGKSIPDADLLIAATAITQNMSLKTRDEHFERLKKLGLRLTQTDKTIK
jgi:predicted nucleic acid-binding protein